MEKEIGGIYMKNNLTPELENFINKARMMTHELYEEFNSIDDACDLPYECQLTRFINNEAYDFYLTNATELIKESK